MHPILHATDQLTSELSLLSKRGLKACKDFKGSPTPPISILNSVRADFLSLLVGKAEHICWKQIKKIPQTKNLLDYILPHCCP